MIKLLLIILVFLFSIIDCLSQNWIVQQVGANINFKACCFLDANTGFTTGPDSLGGLIFKTTNGGLNWNSIRVMGFGQDRSIYFVDANTGFASIGSGIFKTTDGGNNWIDNYYNNGHSLRCISFFNSNTGYAVGYNFEGKILRSTNCGAVWVENTNGSTSTITSIYTISGTGTAYYVTSAGSIRKTISYGLTWTVSQLNRPYELMSVHFENVNTGYAVGYNAGTPWFNVFLKTTNGGTTWDSSGCGGSWANSVYFTSVNTGYIASYPGMILTTTNSGLNWNSQTVTSKKINSIFFPNALTGYAVGDSGLILKTTNGGGLTFENNIQIVLPYEYYLYQNYPNPFNSVSKIKYEISKTGRVKLTVCDILGNEIKTLVNEKQSPGTYEVAFDGYNFSSGIYFYKLQTESYLETKKMLMIK